MFNVYLFCKDAGVFSVPPRRILEKDYCESGCLFGDPNVLRRFRHLSMEKGLEDPEQGHCERKHQNHSGSRHCGGAAV